jgi:hypothetical protein
MCTKSKGIHAPCPVCSGEVSGRSDKRFCEVKCKNKHHKITRKHFKSRDQNTAKVQRRNIVLLEGILGKTAKKMRIHKDILFKYGFDINVCSRAFKRGSKFIYEISNYQFWMLSNGIIEVRRLIDVGEYMPGFFERWEIDFPIVESGKNEVEMKNEIKKNESSDFIRYNE